MILDRVPHRASGLSLLAAAASAAVLVGACGSRGPLDDTPVDLDAGVDVVDLDAAPVAPLPVDAGADTGSRPSGPLACGACLFQSCGTQIFACVQSAACRSTLQCVIQDCGGKVDLSCLTKCGNDPAGALAIFQIFQCVTTECGADCNDLLGLLGGLGGGGSGGRGGGGRELTPLEQAFSAWPELASRPAR